MEFKKILFFIILIQVSTVLCMYRAYRARVMPFASVQKGAMKEVFYDLIDQAKTSLLVSVFTFADKEVARKLALAKARGVKVKVIMDSSSDRGSYSVKELLEEFDVPTLVYKASEGINHNKYVIADGNKSWISSMNFTNPAYSKNRESAVLIFSQAVANFYKKDFQETCQLIDEQAKQEQKKKAKFEKKLALERKKHEERMRHWRASQKK